MNKELFIDISKDKVKIALLEDKQLVEYQTETTDLAVRVGDIYLASVSRILQSVNAVFLDIGLSKNGFLHISDIGDNYQSWLNLTKKCIKNNVNSYRPSDFYEPTNIKNVKASSLFKQGQLMPVQVIKEPISNKGVKLSGDISIPGRYIVLVPFDNEIYFSKNLKNLEERKRLKAIISKLKPAQFGVIIRTVAKDVKEKDLADDFKSLLHKWKSLIDKLRETKPKKSLLKEVGKTSGIIRDLLNNNFNQILVNDETAYSEIKTLVQNYSPEQTKIVKLYKNKENIFVNTGISKQINSLFGKKINLPGGPYLFIEHTEALHVIDVNSGNISSNAADKDGKEMAFSVNKMATKEIARQIRLRDIGGIIVVDYIDMSKAEDRKEIFAILKEEMSKDKARHKILPPSKFGLVQITRKRTKPEILVDNDETCPACDGTGKIKNAITLLDEIEKNILYLKDELKEKNIVLYAHPFVVSHIKKGVFNKVWSWFFKYKMFISVRSREDFNIMQYHFTSKDDKSLIERKGG